jgi:hypothetical protein
MLSKEVQAPLFSAQTSQTVTKRLRCGGLERADEEPCSNFVKAQSGRRDRTREFMWKAS